MILKQVCAITSTELEDCFTSCKFCKRVVCVYFRAFQVACNWNIVGKACNLQRRAQVMNKISEVRQVA